MDALIRMVLVFLMSELLRKSKRHVIRESVASNDTFILGARCRTYSRTQLDTVKIDLPDGKRRVFTKYLNDSQEFRILLGASVVYAQGRFFTPNLRPWRGGGSRINIERIVVGCKGLEKIKSEKGDLTGWSASSVFGAITDRAKVFHDAGWEPEILVCNDVGTPEIADFFGLSDKTKKLVMIHAKKAKEGSKRYTDETHRGQNRRQVESRCDEVKGAKAPRLVSGWY